jgi:hypothetical protein
LRRFGGHFYAKKVKWQRKLTPLHDLIDSLPVGFIGYISNGSIKRPQCYPIMFEAAREGKGLLQIKDFQVFIIVDNNLLQSHLPLP